MYLLCILIYVIILVPTYTQYIWTGCMGCLGAIEGAPEDDNWVNSEIHSEAVIKQLWRCTWRTWSSNFDDGLGSCIQASLKYTFDAIIVQSCRSWTRKFSDRTWMTRSSELTDALGCHDWASSEMHFNTVMDRVWRCTWRPWLRNIADRGGGCDRVNLEIPSKAVI